MLSALLLILVVLIVVGVALYLFNTFVTIFSPKLKEAVNVIVWAIAIIWAILHLIGRV